MVNRQVGNDLHLKDALGYILEFARGVIRIQIINLNRYRDIIERFSQLRILVIGDLMVDKYIWGSGIRLSSEAAVPVIKVSREDYSLGGAANIAFHLSNMGATIHLCGLAGYDDAAHHLRYQVSQNGMNAGGIFPSSDRPTTQKIRIMSTEHNQILGRFDYEQSNPMSKEELAMVTQFIRTYADEIDLLILSDHGRGMFQTEDFNRFLKDMTSRGRIAVYAQSRSSCPSCLNWVDCFSISTRLASKLVLSESSQINPEPNLIARAIHSQFGIQNLLLYNGADRYISYYSNGEETFRYAEYSDQILDQTGIGDLVLSVFAASRLCGAGVDESIILAFKCMILKGKQVGTGRVTRDELLQIVS